jgi:thymidylate synthase (FAD)
MNVKLLAFTQLSKEFKKSIDEFVKDEVNGKAVALSAIRTCYSPNSPSSIIPKESSRYFNEQASDNEEGTEADRLIRMIVRSKHVSTLEHTTYTFSIENVSRALLSQLTRHRHFSFSVQSQRYVPFSSNSKSGGFQYVIPQSIKENDSALQLFLKQMQIIQESYDKLRELKIPSEDCRALLPNSASTNLVMTANLRSLLEFYSKRKKGNGAQFEITQLAECLRNCVTEAERWTAPFFQ